MKYNANIIKKTPIGQMTGAELQGAIYEDWIREFFLFYACVKFF